MVADCFVRLPMRLDRFITLSVARPLRSVLGRPADAEAVIPVLMYHSISDRDERHLRDYFKVCTAPDRFRMQMQTLRDHGYVGVDLETGLSWLNTSFSSSTLRAPSPPLEADERAGEHCHLLKRDVPVTPSPVRDDVLIETQRTNAKLRRSDIEGACRSAGALDERGAVDYKYSAPTELNQPGKPKLNGSGAERAGATELLDGGEVSGSYSAFKNLRPVAITFDDGFRDFYTEALPVLAEHGFTATMYLPTALIGETRRSFFPGIRSTLNSRPSTACECLTWSEVREARGVGMRFGSHTVNHPKLYELPWSEIESELRDSRTELEDHLGQSAHSFAYPYAFPEADRDFCSRLRDTLIRCGYRSCVTTIAGRVAKADDAYTLRRLPINGADDPALLLAKLEGAYDWMEPAQRTFKRAKRLVSRGSRRTEAGHLIGNP